jgi:integrase
VAIKSLVKSNLKTDKSYRSLKNMNFCVYLKCHEISWNKINVVTRWSPEELKMANSTKTITIARLERWLKNAKYKQVLHGDVSGLECVKIKDGFTWRVRYSFNGKRRRIKIGGPEMKPAEAELRAIEINQLINQGRDPLLEKEKTIELQIKERLQRERESELNKQLTVGSFFQNIYTPHKQASRYGRGTLDCIKSNFGYLFDKDMREITVEDIRKWEQERRSQGISRSTLVRDLGAFKAMLNFAAGTKHGDPIDTPVIESNPIKDVRLRKITAKERDTLLNDKTKSKRRMLTQDEISNIYNGIDLYIENLREKRRSSRAHGKKHLPCFDSIAFPHWIEPFTMLALHTGFRPGDIYALKWDSDSDNTINLSFKRIVITPEKTRDKGNTPIVVNHSMSEELQSIVHRWWVQQGKPLSGFVFPNKSGNRLDRKAHEVHWLHIKRFGGLGDLNFYSLRHHFISALVQNNVPMLHIAKMVGHSSTDMIQKNYGHLAEDTAAEVLAQFSQSIARSKPNLPKKERKHNEK